MMAESATYLPMDEESEDAVGVVRGWTRDELEQVEHPQEFGFFLPGHDLPELPRPRYRWSPQWWSPSDCPRCCQAQSLSVSEKRLLRLGLSQLSLAAVKVSGNLELEAGLGSAAGHIPRVGSGSTRADDLSIG